MRRDHFAAFIANRTSHPEVATLMFREGVGCIDSTRWFASDLASTGMAASKKLPSDMAAMFALKTNDPVWLHTAAEQERRVTVLRAVAENSHISDETFDLLADKAIAMNDAPMFQALLDNDAQTRKIMDLVADVVLDGRQFPEDAWFSGSCQRAALRMSKLTARHVDAMAVAYPASLSMLVSRLLASTDPVCELPLDMIAARFEDGTVDVDVFTVDAAAGEGGLDACAVSRMVELSKVCSLSLVDRIASGRMKLSDGGFDVLFEAIVGDDEDIRKFMWYLVQSCELSQEQVARLVDASWQRLADGTLDTTALCGIMLNHPELVSEIVNGLAAAGVLDTDAGRSFVMSLPVGALGEVTASVCGEALECLARHAYRFDILLCSTDSKFVWDASSLAAVTPIVRSIGCDNAWLVNALMSWFSTAGSHADMISTGGPFPQGWTAPPSFALWREMLDLVTAEMLHSASRADGFLKLLTRRAEELFGDSKECWEMLLAMSDGLAAEPVSQLLSAIAAVNLPAGTI